MALLVICGNVVATASVFWFIVVMVFIPLVTFSVVLVVVGDVVGSGDTAIFDAAMYFELDLYSMELPEMMHQKS